MSVKTKQNLTQEQKALENALELSKHTSKSVWVIKTERGDFQLYKEYPHLESLNQIIATFNGGKRNITLPIPKTEKELNTIIQTLFLKGRKCKSRQRKFYYVDQQSHLLRLYKLAQKSKTN